MDAKEEDPVAFYRAHAEDEAYKQCYQRLGYLSSDLEEISLSLISKESEQFTQSLTHNDCQYYIKKKYEAMVLRRHKILKDVYEEFSRSDKKEELRNVSAISDRIPRAHPVVHELKSQQSSFYEKEHNYYQKVKSIKLRKFQQAQQIAENSYVNSEHYKTLREKSSELSLSDRKSVRSCTSRDSSINDQKRRKVYNQFVLRNRMEQELKRNGLTEKMSRAREKIERVYRNLRVLTMEKKFRADMENQLVQKNKIHIKKTIFEEIDKKKQRTNNQMERFSVNRRQQLSRRDQRLMSQRNIHSERQRGVEQYIDTVVRKNRETFSRQLDSQLTQAQRNKKKLDELRKQELHKAAEYNQQREREANKTKELLHHEKMKRNFQMYMVYTRNLSHAVQSRDQHVKSVKTKLLDEKIKDQLAHKNQVILERQDLLRRSRIKEKIEAKVETVEQIEKLKHRLIEDRRVFLGRTLKRMRIMDRELTDKIGTISYFSPTRSVHQGNDKQYDRANVTTSSKVNPQ